MLTLEELRLGYDSFALNADFTIPAGRITAMIGPSGGGKSTLLSVIAGFMAPRTGRILWDGTDISGLAPGDRPLSILFQDNNLFPHLSVARNVALGIRPGRPTPDERTRVRQSLDHVGLSGLEDRRPAQLSGGQIARVALARALLRAKPLMLLDEPFAALGPALKAEMLELVTKTAAESAATVLMISHDPRDAMQMADLTILVADGTALAPQNTRRLFENPPDALSAYLGTARIGKV